MQIITRTLVLFAVLALALGAALGQNDASKAYRCTAKDAVTIRDDGTFDKDPIAEARRKCYDGIVINPLTGAITHPSDGSRENWRAIREASTEDYVFIPEKSLTSLCEPRKMLQQRQPILSECTLGPMSRK